MERGRTNSRRKKVQFNDVVPSTDLPPLVEGELRCFLNVTIGRLSWGSIPSAKTPPVSPAYLRLRWWGEASDGTLFRPQEKKENGTIFKSRSQFGIRSGPKQMTAYFNDMGSITFDILSSPKCISFGRVQIPHVSTLTSSKPIHGFYPIISSSSSRNLGEVHVSISFKPLKSAYDECDSFDTELNTSVSSRSWNTSAFALGSRQISRSSRVVTPRSRSSSAGSYRQNRGRSRSKNIKTKSGKKRSTSSSQDQAINKRQSHSYDSNISTNGKCAQQGNGIPENVPTPRGVDDLLEKNGHDLYALGLKKTEKKSTQPKKVMSSQCGSIDLKAIQELLQRGKILRNEIAKSDVTLNTAMQTPTMDSSDHNVTISSKMKYIHTPEKDSMPEPVQNMKIVHPLCDNLILKNNGDMRIVDMVLRAKGIKDDMSHLAEVSCVSSNLESLNSDLEDPLNDDSILQHLLYSNTEKVTLPHQTASEGPCQPHEKISSKNSSVLSLLNHINLVRITVKGIQLRPNVEPSIDDSQTKLSGISKKHLYMKVKPSKPDCSSPLNNQQSLWTYFVEYSFPIYVKKNRSVATSHDVTRIISKKVTPGGLVKFEQHSMFPIKFSLDNLSKWMTESLLFNVYCKNTKTKAVLPLGSASLPLRQVVESENLQAKCELELLREFDAKNASISGSVPGCIIVCVELTRDKHLSTEMSQFKEPQTVKLSNAYAVTKSDSEMCPQQEFFYGSTNSINGNAQLTLDIFGEQIPKTNERVLYLYVMLKEARGIPATKAHLNTEAEELLPNTFLVCRSLALDEASTSSIVWRTSNPKFNYTQVTPVKINRDLLSRLHDNFMVVEVWTKVTTSHQISDKLMGLVKIPLDIFYQSFKEEQVSRATLESEYPMISVDCFLPIVDVFTGQPRGRLLSLVALGSKEQIEKLRKIKEFDSEVFNSEFLEDKPPEVVDEFVTKCGIDEHSFEILINSLEGFKPQDNQVWGESDCFIQYKFPVLQSDDMKEVWNAQQQKVEAQNPHYLMAQFRSETTLCIPNPKFELNHKHGIKLPCSIPVQQILLSSCSGVGKYSEGSIPFELWSRYYYPNARDQLVAKGWLPVITLCNLVMKKQENTSQHKISVPMQFVDADTSNSPSAGHLKVTVTYRLSNNQQKQHDFNGNIKLEVAVLRAFGLKRAAEIAASVCQDTNLDHCIQAGVNTYALMKMSFLQDEKSCITCCVNRSFIPNYNHHFDILCPLIRDSEGVSPISLAELLASGEINIEIWHKPATEDSCHRPATEDSCHTIGVDVLLGRATIPTMHLLTRTTGVNNWFTLTSIESSRKSIVAVGGLEVSIRFPCQHDLDLLLRAASFLEWHPSNTSDLNGILLSSSDGTLKPIESVPRNKENTTASINITDAWLSKSNLCKPDCAAIDQQASVYLCYKFFDRARSTSKPCSVLGPSPKKRTKEKDPISVKISHRKSFMCKSGRPLIWYLREELLEIQVWLTYSRSSRVDQRPLNSDKLLGTAQVPLTSLLAGGLHKQKHIGGLYPLFNTDDDCMLESCLRVYISLSPDDPSPSDFDTVESDTSMLLSSSSLCRENGGNSDKIEINLCKPDSDDRQTVFSAIVLVERAMHLPQFSSPASDAGYYISYAIGEQSSKTAVTNVACSPNSCPVWQESSDVKLDRKMLHDEKQLIFRVWHQESANRESSDKSGCHVVEAAADRMIGFAAVDISTLSAGFAAVNGWYNVMDIHGACRGQLKVAVTPTEPVYPATTRANPRKPISSFTKGLLYSVPLVTPVQTPSGSMYLPCVTSSQGKLTTTSSLFRPQSSVNINAAPATTVASVAAANFPSRSLNSRDHQQTCLLHTLQRQMKELDVIKCRFENTNTGSFSSLLTVPTVMYSDNTSSETLPLITQLKSSEIKPPPEIQLSEDIVNDMKTTTYPLQTSPSFENEQTYILKSAKPIKSTLHMSLFEPDGKSLGDDGVALSDNDMSDIEFVSPKNLNQPIFSPLGGEMLDPMSPKKQIESNEESSGESMHTNNTGSEFNNTSLWFSGASQIICTLADSPSGSQSKHDEPFSKPPEDQVPRKLFDDEDDENFAPCDVEPDFTETANKEETFVRIADKDGEISLVNGNRCSDFDDSRSVVDGGLVTASNFEVVQMSDIATSPKEKVSMVNEEEQVGASNKDNSGVEDGISEVNSSITVENVTESNPVEDKTTNDNTKLPMHPPQSAWPTLQSFFPPSKDMVANMRSLQAITKEQKRHLDILDSSDSNPCCATAAEYQLVPSSSCRKLVKPSTKTEKQTNRLARIFNTKFTSG